MLPKDPQVPTLLGKKTTVSLDLLHISPVVTNTIQQDPLTNQLVVCTIKVKGNAASPHHYPPKASEPSTNHITQTYSDIFQGTAKLKNYKLQLHINHHVTPVQGPVQQIPFYTRKKSWEGNTETTRIRHYQKISRPTSLLNPIVPVPKEDQTIQLCIDMRWENTAIIHERLAIPQIKDILPDVHNTYYFSKIDQRLF